jgi:hypothetical protein
MQIESPMRSEQRQESESSRVITFRPRAAKSLSPGSSTPKLGANPVADLQEYQRARRGGLPAPHGGQCARARVLHAVGRCRHLARQRDRRNEARPGLLAIRSHRLRSPGDFRPAPALKKSAGPLLDIASRAQSKRGRRTAPAKPMWPPPAWPIRPMLSHDRKRNLRQA